MIVAPGTSVTARAAALRRDFDRAFAEPVRANTAEGEDLLQVRVGGHAYAIRLGEIAGLYVGGEITRIPGGSAGLLGLAGFRGTLLPVYDLRVLLGTPSTDAPRYLVIAAAAPLALAFEAFERRLRVPHDAFSEPEADPDAANCARQFVRAPDFTGPVLQMASVIEAISRSTRAKEPEEEQ